MSHLVLFLLAARDGIFFTDRWFLPSDTICAFISYGIICCFAWAMYFIKKRSFQPSFLILMEEKREGKKPNNEQLRTFNEINLQHEVAAYTQICLLNECVLQWCTLIICFERATWPKHLLAFIHCSFWHASTRFSNRIIFISILLCDRIIVFDPRDAFQP